MLKLLFKLSNFRVNHYLAIALIWVIAEILTMIRFGRVKRIERFDFGYDRCVFKITSIELGNKTLGFDLLFRRCI